MKVHYHDTDYDLDRDTHAVYLDGRRVERPVSVVVGAHGIVSGYHGTTEQPWERERTWRGRVEVVRPTGEVWR